MSDTYRTINDVLVELINNIWELEGNAVITDEFKDITNNDMHVIEAIGIGKGKNMFLIFRVAPDHGPFFRGFGGDGVHNVVGKVKIVRIMEGNAL